MIREALIIGGAVIAAVVAWHLTAAWRTKFEAEVSKDLASFRNNLEITLQDALVAMHLRAAARNPAPLPSAAVTNMPSIPPAAMQNSAPPGTPLVAPTAQLVDGIQTPGDTTYVLFGSLVTAAQAVMNMLADKTIDLTKDGITSFAWWCNQGPFMREEYLLQAKGAVLARFQGFQAQQGAPPLVAISVMDQTCALAAVNAVAPPTTK